MTGEILIEKSLEFVKKSPAPDQCRRRQRIAAALAAAAPERFGWLTMLQSSRTDIIGSARRGCLLHSITLGGFRRCPHPSPGWTPTWNTPVCGPTCTITSFRVYRVCLSPQLRPKYVVRVEERTYISDDSDPTLHSCKCEFRMSRWPSARGGKRPDSLPEAKVHNLEVAEPVIATTWLEEEIHEAFLKIIDRESRDVVTVIEILSPANKLPGSPGRHRVSSRNGEKS